MIDYACSKQCKISILANLVNTANHLEIVSELNEYVMDFNREISSGAIASIGKIGVLLDCALSEVINYLFSYLDYKNIEITRY